MERRPNDGGLRSAVIVWALGLLLGVLAGVATARLLMGERQGDIPPAGTSVRDRLLGR
ncbi:MAG: hypothetical protein NZM40_03360 [Sphingomonadaceae bacterium]|uniref:hypothetical protein n=1 Tax=Thermaurantiacus sp. TaxID=2820283 RepID=UPI00298EEC68|nr:hypothetical protein [Thermaurantiacus sp.]MCS6986462.1 hypothetical protein [Sphingomonadaceae bacterium]MDW8414277.1 hypothetical protein [Thermaurantiacus sp.]